MNNLFIYVLLILCTSCSKQDSGEYATENNQTSIVGKWKLFEYRSMDSHGNIVAVDKTSDNQIISFDSLGNTTDPRFSCKGKYTLAEDTRLPSTRNPILTISFDCKTIENNIEIMDQKYRANVRDNNYLVLNLINCVEMCTYEFRRLKE